MDFKHQPQHLTAISWRLLLCELPFLVISAAWAIHSISWSLCWLAIILYVHTGLWLWQNSMVPEKKLHPIQVWGLLIPTFIWLVISILSGIPLILIELWHPTRSADIFFNLLLPLTAAIALYATVYCRLHVSWGQLSLTTPNWPRAFNNYKILHISDLHVGNFTSAHWLQRIIKKINNKKPDMIVITGDLINFGDQFLNETITLIAQLQAKDGVYFSSGNHDFFLDHQQLLRQLQQTHIKVLDNNQITITKDQHAITVMAIPGVVSNLPLNKKHLYERIQQWNKVGGSILLAHDSTIFADAATHNIDLTLSGHTHGGQLALPGLSKRYNLASNKYTYCSGHYQINNSHCYVSRGLGVSIIPLRFAVRPEVITYTLQSRAQTSG